MLTLNEKKIRKGKPVGLPYQGSKKKVSKKIVEIIKQNFGEDKTVYDLFGGGGAITAELMINGMDVVYNDFNKDVTDMFELVMKSDREFLKTLLVSRDEFLVIRDKETKTPTDNLKLLVNSFGNRSEGYLYGKSVADKKYELALEIISNHDVFSGYKQTDAYKSYLGGLQQLQQLGQLGQLGQLEQLQHLQQLERLQRLQQLQQLQQLELIPYNHSYEHYSDVSGSILYLDPPYEGTCGYEEKRTVEITKDKYQEMRNRLLNMPGDKVIIEDGVKYHISPNATQSSNRMYASVIQPEFDSQSFYDWAVEMSKNNIVILSSYTVSDPRFECVYEFKTARSAMQMGTSNRDDKMERLFMVKQDV